MTPIRAWAEDRPGRQLRQAGDLQVDAVLIGPEPRYVGIGSRLARHRLTDGDTVVLGVPPGLQAQMAVE